MFNCHSVICNPFKRRSKIHKMEVARDKLTVDVLRVIQQIFGLINEDVVHIVYSLRQQKNNFKKFQKIVLILLKTELIKTGGGRNVDDQNVDRPKISERRNGLFS
jgi:hypothetical protein